MKQKVQLILLSQLCVVSLLSLLCGPAEAAEDAWEPYVPPELIFSDDLRQKIRVPEKVNINFSSLNQLLALPGFDEELALKVIRNRPFVRLQDFYAKMPELGKKNIARLIQQTQAKVMFK